MAKNEDCQSKHYIVDGTGFVQSTMEQIYYCILFSTKTTEEPQTMNCYGNLSFACCLAMISHRRYRFVKNISEKK